MAKKRHVSIRISDQRLEALISICSEMLQGFDPVNDHHYLLREYMLELYDKLNALNKKPQQDYTLTLSGPEAVAFYQLWNLLDIRHNKYAAVIVETMMKKMSALAA